MRLGARAKVQDLLCFAEMVLRESAAGLRAKNGTADRPVWAQMNHTSPKNTVDAGKKTGWEANRSFEIQRRYVLCFLCHV